MNHLQGKVQLALRKCKTKGNSLKAKDLKEDDGFEKLVHLDEGYKVLRTLRGSPLYFEKTKRDLFAMIRQLGPATLFCSFSAAETRWIHLLQILKKLLDNVDITEEEAKNLNWDEKCRLIQSDPVTCARHFDYSVQCLINNFLKSHLAPLGVIQDFF